MLKPLCFQYFHGIYLYKRILYLYNSFFTAVMTAFSAANLPTTVNTFERLAAYASLALTTINPNIVTTEGELFDDNGVKIRDITERVSQANVFYIASTGELRLLCRQSFLLSPDYYAGGQRNWTYVQEFVGSNALPATFNR
jgi:hypothetical protein